MKYCIVLIVIILSATTLCAEQIKAVSEQETRARIGLLSDEISTIREELVGQKKLHEEQHTEIVSLKDAETISKAEFLYKIGLLEQSDEKLEKIMIKARQSIKSLKKTISEVNSKGEQQNVLIEQQSVVVETLQREFDEYKGNQKKLFEQLSERVGLLEETLKTTRTALNERVGKVGQEVVKNKSEVDGFRQEVNDTTKQLGGWIGAAALLGLLGVGFGFAVRKKLADNSGELEESLSKMRTRIDEESVKLDGKLIELLERQMALSQELTFVPAEAEVDHSLPLRVGTEILRLRQRIEKLEDDTKGIRPMLKSLERLEGEFNDSGYELVEMLGKPYDDGLNVKARFIPSDDISPGENIISKVIKPQINFNGVSIQFAEIEVITGGE